MTQQAREKLALELGFCRLFLRERVEDGAKLRIHGGDFENRAGLHRAHIDVLIEVDRSWILGRNQKELQTCFRKDQCLRCSRNLQLLQQSWKIAVFGIELQREVPGV